MQRWIIVLEPRRQISSHSSHDGPQLGLPEFRLAVKLPSGISSSYLHKLLVCWATEVFRRRLRHIRPQFFFSTLIFQNKPTHLFDFESKLMHMTMYEVSSGKAAGFITWLNVTERENALRLHKCCLLSLSEGRLLEKSLWLIQHSHSKALTPRAPVLIPVPFPFFHLLSAHFSCLQNKFPFLPLSTCEEPVLNF